MTQIYGQLRVSCGLSATLNAMQPESLKATTTQTFATWLDVQFARLTHNRDPADPLTQLAENRREFGWAIVLDYILLRKIRSSFRLCDGLMPGHLVLEVEVEHLDWNRLKPSFLKILKRLNATPDDWPLWHYEGEYKEPEKALEDNEIRIKMIPLIQSIKMFWEIYQSNLISGPEAEWKKIFMNMVGFPEQFTHDHIVFHIDHYKTDFELAGLLETLGYELDSTYGRSYPKSVVPHSIVLINRPEHWVCEDSTSRGVVLDSLTQGTDSIHAMDSFNYFKPKQNLREFRKWLPKLEKLFPQIDVDVKTEDLTEFPELELPETDNPEIVAQEHFHKANAAYQKQDLKNALLAKRIEYHLRKKAAHDLQYYKTTLTFFDWCLEGDKLQTAEELLKELLRLESLEDKNFEISPNLLAKRAESSARYYLLTNNASEASKALEKALDLYDKAKDYDKAYTVANHLGVALYRNRQYEEALKLYEKALIYAEKAIDKQKQEGAASNGAIIANSGDEGTFMLLQEPKKYWPAIVKAIKNKIEYIKKNNITSLETENSAHRIE